MDQPSSPPIPIIQSHVKNMATLVNADANTDNPLHTYTYHIQTGHLATEPPKQSECRSWDRQQRESASFRSEQANEEYVNDMGAYEITTCLIVITGVSKPELGAQLMLVHSDPDWSLNTGICGHVCFPWIVLWWVHTVYSILKVSLIFLLFFQFLWPLNTTWNTPGNLNSVA